jgi:hypothetical protein
VDAVQKLCLFGAAIGSVLILAGCEEGASSPQPFFAARDAALAQMKTGVWELTEPSCGKTGSTLPTQNCELPLVVGVADIHPVFPSAPREASSSELEQHAKIAGALTVKYVLASGDPLILQLTMRKPDARPGEAADEQVYATVKPVRQDADGRLLEVQMDLVPCRPWNAQGNGPAFRAYFSGFRPSSDGGCVVSTAAALRDAVAGPPDPHRDVFQLKWVREGDR